MSLEKKFDFEMQDLLSNNRELFREEKAPLDAELKVLFEKVRLLSEKYGIPCEFAGHFYNPSSIKDLYPTLDYDDCHVFYDYDDAIFGNWWAPSTC